MRYSHGVALGSHVPEWKVAGIYVLVLWIAVGKIVSISRGQVTRSDLDEDGVGAAMRRAMPKIEALTLSLPPPNPEPAEGAGKQHA